MVLSLSMTLRNQRSSTDIADKICRHRHFLGKNGQYGRFQTDHQEQIP